MSALKMHRRGLLMGLAQGLTLASLSLSLPRAHAEVASINDAINKAGRQRMLSQRMAKAWLALGQGIEPRRADKVLADSMALFERQLAELKAFAPTPEIKATYAALTPAWSDYKAALVERSPDRAAAAHILDLDARVLRLAHQGTVQLEAVSGRHVGKLVNLAGRQRMLSQRTAKFYLCQRWGTQVPGAARELETARREFVAALNVLELAPQATDAIREELTLARQQWVFFDNALNRIEQNTASTRHASEVFTTSEHILQVMDEVTGLYSQLA